MKDQIAREPCAATAGREPGHLGHQLERARGVQSKACEAQGRLDAFLAATRGPQPPRAPDEKNQLSHEPHGFIEDLEHNLSAAETYLDLLLESLSELERLL